MRVSSLFSRDHKVIGLQYGITSLLFLLLGFLLILLIGLSLLLGRKVANLVR